MKDRKRLALIGLALVLGLLVSIVTLPTFAVEGISFPDPLLESAIRDELKRPSGEIYEWRLRDLTVLNLVDKGITNLEGIQLCVNLEGLSLYGNKLTDIHQLSGLSKLEWLSLSRNYTLVDISPLAGLSNLQTLYLYSTEVVDIHPLSDLTRLSTLILHSNRIVDISPLSDLPNLIELDLHNNLIVNIGPLVSNPWIGRASETCSIDLSGNCLNLTPGSPDTLNINSLEARDIDFDSDLENQKNCQESESDEPAPITEPTPVPTPYIPPYTPPYTPPNVSETDLEVTWEYRWDGNSADGAYVNIKVTVKNVGNAISSGTSCWFGMQDIGNWYYDQTDSRGYFRDYDIAPNGWRWYEDFLWVPFGVWTKLVIIIQNDQGEYIREESRTFYTG